VPGFTGLGVGASRVAVDVLLDLSGDPSARTELEMVRTTPLPFPPEPLRSLVVARTKRSLAHADDHGGRRGAWLRLLEYVGVGFDSRARAATSRRRHAPRADSPGMAASW
jgi:hypothetical protein